MKAVIRADVDAHLACRAGLPDDTDAPVVLAGHEQPWLNILESFVGIQDRLRLPDGGQEVGFSTIRSVGLPGYVIPGIPFVPGFRGRVHHLLCGPVVIPIREPLPDERERTKHGDQRHLEWIPEQIPEVGSC